MLQVSFFNSTLLAKSAFCTTLQVTPQIWHQSYNSKEAAANCLCHPCTCGNTSKKQNGLYPKNFFHLYMKPCSARRKLQCTDLPEQIWWGWVDGWATGIRRKREISKDFPPPYTNTDYFTDRKRSWDTTHCAKVSTTYGEMGKIYIEKVSKTHTRILFYFF